MVCSSLNRIFSIFHFPLLAGEYHSLKEPHTALLLKSTAEKYFGDWRPGDRQNIPPQQQRTVPDHGYPR